MPAKAAEFAGITINGLICDLLIPEDQRTIGAVLIQGNRVKALVVEFAIKERFDAVSAC